MLSQEEMTAAQAEKKYVMPEEMIEKYDRYHQLKSQAKRLEAEMDGIKEELRAYAESMDAKNLIDPDNGRSMVSLTEKTRLTADKKLMIEELGEEVVDMYFKPSTFVEMRVN